MRADLAVSAALLLPQDAFLQGEMDTTKASALKHLNCGICKHLVASSLVLSCGHMFCGSCLYTHVSEKPLCPSCKVGPCQPCPSPYRPPVHLMWARVLEGKGAEELRISSGVGVS